MNLDAIVGSNVVIQLSRAIYVLTFMPDKGWYGPAFDPQTQAPILTEVVQGKLAKDEQGTYVLVYANPADNGKSNIHMRLDPALIAQACVVKALPAPVEPAATSDSSSSSPVS